MVVCKKLDAFLDGMRLEGSDMPLSQIDLGGCEPCIVRELRAAVVAENWLRFERLVVVAGKYPSSTMTGVLCEVLNQRLEDINNEDIIDVLGTIADPAAIGTLQEALLWQPPWDEFHSIGVKSVWALAGLGGPEALRILRDVAAIGPAEVREAAVQKLRAVMTACLIDRFFAEEFNDHVRAVVEEVAAAEAGARYLTFNVFNVAIDLDSGLVTVEDELDASAECTVSLASFLERVREGSTGS